MKTFVQYLILYIVESMGLIIHDPIFFLIMIYSIMMYKRQIEEVEGPQTLIQVTKKVVPDIVISMILGIITSGILSYVGINFYVHFNILVLIPIAILLMLIHPKWGCFSYVIPVAFMIEGLSKLFDHPLFTLDYEMLIYLVGVLHIIEGLLVLICGYKNAKPTPFYEDNRLTYHKVLQHLWLIPFIVISTPQGVPMPLYAILAYGDEARVRSPRKQSMLTGMLILGFGAFIFILAHAMHLGYIQAGGLILIMPVLHELIFVTETYMNKK